MKAIRQHRFGGPDVLVYEDAPMPVPAAGEVLVRVHAIGINPPDWYLRDGYRSLPPDWQPAVTFPLILGSDVSGVVVAVAPGVTRFKVGDEVFGMLRFPSMGDSAAYADYVAAPAAHLALKPSGIDHAHAAAAPMVALTAWQFLVELGHDVPNPLQAARHVPVPLAGQTVLVNGAAGGVGHVAVQVAKLQGANVIAAASGRHAHFLRELGADDVIDYTRSPPEETVRGIDLVVDTVGGPTTGRFLQTLKAGGALFPLFPLGFTGAEAAARQGYTVSATQVRSNGEQLARIAELMASNRLRIAIDSAYPLADAAAAHARAAAGHLRGKLVLIPQVEI
jgi:NADPH:quinone reductase-like Zn-dependent oxidoreductase